jgi:hypothetical protein
MGAFAALLVGISGSVAARVLTSLGIGFLSYQGLNALISKITSMVESHYSSLDSQVFGLFQMSGAVDYIQIVLSACTVKAAMMALKKLAPLAS